MKNWTYKVESSSQDVIKKLESALVTNGGFDFPVDSDSTSFEIRKPVRYPDQILHRNRLIIQGKISNSDTENKKETDVELSFAQDFYMKMTVFSMFVLGGILIVLISTAMNGATMYLLCGIVIVVGIVLWMALQKKLERDTQQYKTLISDILESS